MPSGYAAATVWAITLILWWSGWRKEMADGLPKAAVIGYLAGWPLLARLTVPIPIFGSASTVGAAFLWTLAFALAAAIRIGAAKSGAVCAAGALLGSVSLFIDKLTEGLPSLLPSSPLWVSSAIIAFITTLLIRGAAEQVVALTLGLTLTESIFAVWELHQSGHIAVGTLAWSDRWWLSYSAIRLLSVAAAWLPALARRREWRRGGERS